MSPADALRLSEQLIALAVLLQTIELLLLRRIFSSKGVWAWETLEAEFRIFPRFLRLFFDKTLPYPHILGLFSLRLFSAFVLLILPIFCSSPAPAYLHSILIGTLFFSTLLITLRFRGTFNGGSDYMTIVILMAVFIASLFSKVPMIVYGCLFYIAVQCCSSYFIAGVVKVRRKNWRDGSALTSFLRDTIYEPHHLIEQLSNSPRLLQGIALFIIAFECSFPFAFLSPLLCLGYIGVAVCFHLVNAAVFGLNRFLFAWIAAYPALYFCAQELSL